MPDRATRVIMDLPDRDYLWFRDLNVVGLASHLDHAGRERALAAYREEVLADMFGRRGAEIPPQRHVTVHVTVPIPYLPSPAEAPFSYQGNQACGQL